MSKANGLQFTAQIGELPSEVFSVVSFELTESLSQLFFGRLQLASTDSDIDPCSVLEQSVDLVIWQHNEPLRRFTSVVSDFVIGDNGHHRTRYGIVLQSPLWRLELMYNSRIFQGQTTEFIASALLQERGIPAAAFQLTCRGDIREYCVQHRESDLAFIQRLAAEEGWHYRYCHGSDMVLWSGIREGELYTYSVVGILFAIAAIIYSPLSSAQSHQALVYKTGMALLGVVIGTNFPHRHVRS
jgi:type VI secretion system secreted protein VgrG